MITSEDIILSDDEIAVLSRGPKFTLRNILDKEQSLLEFEKGLIKEKYSRIGKEEENGKVVVEELDEEDRRLVVYSEWLEMRARMIFDFEEGSLDLAGVEQQIGKLINE